MKNESQELIKETHMNMSDFEKGLVALQQLAGPIQLGQKMRVIIDYDPQSPIAVFKYFKKETHAREGENDFNFSKTYQHEQKEGTKAVFTITAEAKDVDKKDLEEILHNFADSSKNFYLSFGNEINSKL